MKNKIYDESRVVYGRLTLRITTSSCARMWSRSLIASCLCASATFRSSSSSFIVCSWSCSLLFKPGRRDIKYSICCSLRMRSQESSSRPARNSSGGRGSTCSQLGQRQTVGMSMYLLAELALALHLELCHPRWGFPGRASGGRNVVMPQTVALAISFVSISLGVIRAQSTWSTASCSWVRLSPMVDQKEMLLESVPSAMARARDETRS